MSCEKIFTDEAETKRTINPQIFIVVQLKHIASGKHVSIVCIHLKSKEENEEKRWQQMEYVLGVLKEHVQASLRHAADGDMKKHPVIICGDFNGEPFERFYKCVVEMNEMKLRDAYSVRPSSNNQVEAVPKQVTTVKLRHSYGGMLKRAIDYVFYAVDCLQLTEVLELPLDDQFLREQGLPNLKYSSDHLALACGFRFFN